MRRADNRGPSYSVSAHDCYNFAISTGAISQGYSALLGLRVIFCIMIAVVLIILIPMGAILY